MIRFAPTSQDLQRAMRSIDTIAPEEQVWLVPAGDGKHVDVRARSDTQLVSIRLTSKDPVEDGALSVVLPHQAVHLLGSITAISDESQPVLFECDSTTWSAATSVGKVTGSLDEGDEPDWERWMVPPVDDCVTVDPELIGGKMLATMLRDEIPAYFGTTGEGTMLVIMTQTVRLWTLGMRKVYIN